MKLMQQWVLKVCHWQMIKKCLEGESSFDTERQSIFKEIALLNE